MNWLPYWSVLAVAVGTNALPHNTNSNETPQQPYELDSSGDQFAKPKTEDDCTSVADKPDCREDQKDGQLSSKVLICLDNCADCVKQWRTGVYNGRYCANDCMQQAQDPVESMDPDCNLVKYFNSTVLAGL